MNIARTLIDRILPIAAVGLLVYFVVSFLTLRQSETITVDRAVADGESGEKTVATDYEIITLLPPDGIPAVYNPRFLTAQEADQFYDPDELVMGVSFNGDSRAYSIPYLSGREIVDDTVGGRKIAVTW